MRCRGNYTKESCGQFRDNMNQFTLFSFNKATKSFQKGFYTKIKTFAMGVPIITSYIEKAQMKQLLKNLTLL